MANCPNNAALYCEGEDRITPRHFKKGIHWCGVVEGVRVNGILLDTGATQSMVREDLVPPDRRADGETTITCAHGDRVVYPLTAVSVGVGSQHLIVRAGVSRTLPVPVLLGRDVPELEQLLESESGTAPEPQESGAEDVLTAFSHTVSRPARPRVAAPESRVQGRQPHPTGGHGAQPRHPHPTRGRAQGRHPHPTERSNASPTPQEATERNGASPTPQEATAHSGASPTPGPAKRRAAATPRGRGTSGGGSQCFKRGV